MRVPGQRGLATRDRFLRQIEVMLADTPYRELKVVDIARGSGTSPATFYQYFADAEEAFLALAQQTVSQGAPRLAQPVVDGEWTTARTFDTCTQIAGAFLEFWDDHGSIMAVIDLAALEGDDRFREIRTSVLNPFTEAIGEVIRERVDEGTLAPDVDPVATASVLVAMLAHVSGHRYGIEAYGTSTDAIKLSMTRQLHAGLTGSVAPR